MADPVLNGVCVCVWGGGGEAQDEFLVICGKDVCLLVQNTTVLLIEIGSRESSLPRAPFRNRVFTCLGMHSGRLAHDSRDRISFSSTVVYNPQYVYSE